MSNAKNLRRIFEAYGELMHLKATCQMEGSKDPYHPKYPVYINDLNFVCACMMDIFRYLSGEDDELIDYVDWDEFKMRWKFLTKCVHISCDVVDLVEKKMNGEW